MMKFQFKPKLLPSIAFLLLLPLLIYLGFWQLGRAEYKRSLLVQYNSRLHTVPVSLQTLTGSVSNWQYRRLQISGHFDNAHSFLLDNKFFNHQPGYHILTPFLTNKGGQAILINRGWLPQGRSRAQLPVIPSIDENVSLVGIISLPPVKTFTLTHGLSSKPQWPNRIEQLKLADLSKDLAYPLAPFVLLLAPDQLYGFNREWSPVVLKPEMHTAYAVQWFAMAATLFILFLVVSFKREKTTRDK